MQARTLLPLATLVISIGLAMADTPFSNPDALPKVACKDIQYSEAFLQRYPKAPAACVEGRVSNGENWGKFNAKVSDTHYPDSITIQPLNAAGDPTGTLSFKPPAGAKVYVSGKSTPVSQLQSGDVITLWIPQTRLEAGNCRRRPPALGNCYRRSPSNRFTVALLGRDRSIVSGLR